MAEQFLDVVPAAPLFRYRTPLRAASALVGQLSAAKLAYPSQQLFTRKGGIVEMSMVVREDSTVDLSSLQVLRATHIDFVRSVVTGLPELRYAPLVVDGCRVRSEVVQPFTFEPPAPKAIFGDTSTPPRIRPIIRQP